MSKQILRFLYAFILGGMLVLPATGCGTKKNHQSHTKPSSRTHSVDAKTQQRYYDLGLQYYSKEKYRRAKEAFQEVIEISPNNSLGLKAQQNIKKINQILKTVEEIEKK